MHASAHALSDRGDSRLSGSRLLLLLIAGIAALLTLAACGEVDSSTEISADGSGVQTLVVTVSESDMDKIDGGAATVESTIEEHNPGLTYQGMTKNGTDTVFTLTLEFTDAKDYAAKAQPVLAAGDLTKTAEATFTPPTPPFSSGYTLTRNFTARDLTRWAVKALVDEEKIADASESSIDDALDRGEVTVTVDDADLERSTYPSTDSAAVWTNAEAVSFDSVEVVTAGAEDPAADSYLRTLTYELQRATYLDAKDDFDAFFEAATPEGGELTPAGETGTTWTIVFPAGTAEQVAGWTDAALATTGSVFSVEAAPNPEDPFSIDTRVVDTIECTVACGETGHLEQGLEVPVGFSGSTADAPEDPAAAGTEVVALQGGTEPQVFTRTIGFRTASYDLVVDRDGGGSLTMALSLPTADDEVVTAENIIAFLGEGTERSEADGVVTYTRTAEAADSEEFPGALQKLGFDGAEGPPEVSVVKRGDGDFQVSLALGVNGTLHEKLGTDATWTIRGEGLRPTAMLQDEAGTAVLGEEAITVDGQHGVLLVFSAERTGLSAVVIAAILIVLALFGLLIAAGIVAFLNRGRIKALLGGAAQEPAAVDGPGQPGPAPDQPSAARTTADEPPPETDRP
ncbi:hypothetical protein CFK39_08035 [Brachybacterium avium]|uniref:Uncharacterized protein n=1 Tax=Brachybacterium avium TaxID=2017485 RepID=A0A220UCI9_9MICO|nr:hypothetical protein [Brachybacterium avium]ASK65795.1 hypothetical protein CFK39_08035 [Brachybacterium avium]